MVRTRTVVGGVVLAMMVVALAPMPAALAAPPAFSKVFVPDEIGPGSVSTLTFTINNIAEGTFADELAFTDTLPVGVVIATPANASTTCDPDGGGDGPTLSAPAGGGTITFSDAGVGAGKTCTVSVDVTSTSAGIHTNTSGVLMSSAGDGTTATDDLTVAANRPGFFKDFSPDPIDKGERSTLTFTIDNTANNSDVATLDFTDNLPSGLLIADPADASTDCEGPLGTTLTAEPGTSVIVLDADGVAPGNNEALPKFSSCTVDVDVVATAGGTLVNSSDSLLADFEDAGKATATLDVSVAALHITKEFTDDPVPPGGTATVAFTIENFDRDFPATGVGFTDTLPAGVIVATPNGEANTCGGTLTATSGTSSISLAGGTVPLEGSCTITVSVTAAAAGTYTNETGAVSGTVDGEAVVGNTGKDDLFVVPAPILTKEFTDDPVGPGDVVTVEFTITNTSPVSTATDIAFTDEFPVVLPTSPSGAPADGFCGPSSTATFTPLVNPMGGGTIPARLTVSDAELAATGLPDDSCTFSMTLDVAAGTPSGLYPNTTSEVTATVSAMTITGKPARDDLEVIAGPFLDKEFTDDPIKPGASVTLEFTLTNDNPPMPPATTDFTATGIGFTDDLSAVAAGLTLGSVDANDCGGSVTGIGTSTISFSGGGPLAPDTSCTIVVTVDSTTATPQGIHTNTTSDVTATLAGLATTELPASDDLIVVDLDFTKEFTDDPVFPGDTVTVTFTIDNTSTTEDATSISFSDDFDATLDSLALTAAEAATLPRAECGGTLVGLGGGSSVTLSGGSLTAGSDCTITLELDVPGGADAGSYPNTTTGFGADFGSGLVPLPNATDDLIVDERALTITKSFTNDPVAPGDPVTLRITLSNPTVSAPATGLAFTDDLDATLTGLVATGPFPRTEACVPVGGGTGTGTLAITGTQTLDYSGGTLAAGGACRIEVTLTVPAGASAGNYPNTTSTLTGTIDGSPVVATAATDVLKVLEPAPASADLSISKTDSPDPVKAGETLTYTITVANAGISDAANVIVTDVLPAGVTFVSSTGSCVEGPAGTLTCSLGVVPIVPGSKSFDVTVTVDSDTPAGTITNDVSVTSNTSDPDPGNNTASTDTTVEVEADLAISKTDSPDPVVAGKTLTYTVTVDNLGPSDATGVTVVDTLPAGVTYVSDTDSCVEGPTGTLTCAVGAIAAGSSAGFDIEVTVDSDTPAGGITNLASVSSAVPDPVPGNSVTVETTTVVAEADLVITKADLADPAVAGSTVTYTITVDNLGPSDATGVTVVDTVPAGFMYLSDTDTCTPGDPAPGFVTCDVGDVPASSGTFFDVTFFIDPATPPGDVDNVVDVSSDATELDPADNTATETTTIVAEADLVISKVDLADPAVAGSTVTYTITVDNLGPSDATGVTVIDTVPAGFMFDSAAVPCFPGVPGPGELTCDVGDIPASSGTFFDVTFTIDPATPPGDVDNVVDVSSDATELDPADNTATETTTIVAEADLVITKIDDVDPAVAGSTVTYTITVDNLGPSDATGVTVVDTVPAGFMFDSAAVPCFPGVPGPGELTCDVGDIPAGFTAFFDVTFFIDPATPPGDVDNVVDVTSDATELDPADNTATETTTIVAEADLVITKVDLADPAVAGGTVTYTITVDNLGPSDATGVTVVDTVPAGFSLVSNTDACVAGVPGPGLLTCDLGIIPAGTGAAFDVTFLIDPASAPGDVDNVVDVSSDATELDPADNTATETTTIVTEADLAIFKVGDTPVAAGDMVTYSLTVDNLGPSNATGVTVVDEAPPGMMFDSATVPCTPGDPAPGFLTCDLADIPMGGSSGVFDIIFTIDPAAPPGTVTNEATVSSDATDPDPSDNTATADTEIVAAADLAITKVDTEDPVLAGESVTYEIVVENFGPSDATGVTVVDDVPPGLMFSGATVPCTPGVPGPGELACDLGTLAAGFGITFEVTFAIDPAAPAGDVINLVGVSSDMADPLPGNNTATEATTIETEADLDITKSDVPDPVTAGETLTYTIEVFNFGPSVATGVTVVDTLPAGVTHVSDTGFCVEAPAGTLTCPLGTIPVLGMETFEITVAVDSGTTGSLSNTATVDSDVTDPDTSDNTTTETTAVETSADLSITKAASPDPVAAGGTLTYTITVANAGPSDAGSVVVTDVLPAGVSYVSDTDACVEGPAGTLTCSLGTIAASGSTSFDVVVAVGSNTIGTLTNSASVSAATADPVAGNNSATAATAVSTSADLSITKAGSADPVVAGTSLTYTVTVANAGPSVAAGVVVTDTLPAGTSFVSTSGCADDPNSVPTCSLGTIAAGSSKSYTITVGVGASATGVLTNIASVSAATADPNSSNNSTTHRTAVATRADLSITKSDSPDPVRLGGTLTYTVVVANAGPSDATGVVVTDTLPAGVVQVRTTGCAEDPNGVPTCTLGSIAAGASKSYTITVRVTGNTTRDLTNRATVSATTTDPASGNNTATTITTVARPQQPEVGLFDPVTGVWTMLLRSGATRGFSFGNPGDVGIVGDWDGDGDRTVAVFRTLNGDTALFGRNSNSAGVAEFTFQVGEPGDRPVAGDWNGNGRESLALFRPTTGQWFVFFDFANAVPDAVFFFGNPGDAPAAVDIDGDGDADPVAYRDMGALGGHVFVRNSLTSGVHTTLFVYGNPADKLLFGDWDYDGDRTIGVYRPGDATFYLRNTNTTGLADLALPLGFGREWPVAGPF